MRHFRLFLLCLYPFLFGLQLTAQRNSTPERDVNHAVAFGVSAPLRDLAKLPQPAQYGFHEASPVRRIPKHATEQVVDRVEQVGQPLESSSYQINKNFLGVGNGFPNYTVPDAPPDTNMAVGDTQIVQWVNVSYTVCDKSTTACGPAINGNALWSSGIPGTLCANHNAGDPIAQWDRVAHRWLLFQNVFTSPYAVCVAISTSSDANGSYYVSQFSVPGNGFPDYPKWGVWTVNYGQAQNNFGPGGSGFKGPQVCVYNRTKLLAGDPSAEQICHQYTSGEDSLLPADLDSPTNPPSGEDQFFIGSVGDVDNSHLSLYSAHINNPSDWTQGATFTGDGNSQLVAIAPFTPACNGSYGGACVPQKDIPDLLDSLGDRLMYRFAYYDDNPSFPSPKQHWYVNFDVTASGGQNGVRWMEFTAPPSPVGPTDISTLQQGTYAPDGNWRWMGSMARDKSNDVLVGYSESNSGMYPSIFVAGRIPTDTLGTLENELTVVNGTGSQPDTSNRWGDYSAMRIDPTDDCTFWYTTEYYMVTQRFDWSTQIASVNFPRCSAPPPAVSLSAFEVWNRTGETQNEFQEFLSGIDPTTIVGTFNEDYPTVTITGLNGGTLIDWTGGTTPDGTESRFGISFSVNVDPLDSGAAWEKIGGGIPVPVVAQKWTESGGMIDYIAGYLVSRFDDPNGTRNGSSSPPAYVQRRVPPSPAGNLGLSDLFRGGTLWNEAKLIDPDFVVVSRTIRALLYGYPPLGSGEWDVMMYDVLDSNRQLIMTFGNAINGR